MSHENNGISTLHLLALKSELKFKPVVNFRQIDDCLKDIHKKRECLEVKSDVKCEAKSAEEHHEVKGEGQTIVASPLEPECVSESELEHGEKLCGDIEDTQVEASQMLSRKVDEEVEVEETVCSNEPAVNKNEELTKESIQIKLSLSIPYKDHSELLRSLRSFIAIQGRFKMSPTAESQPQDVDRKEWENDLEIQQMKKLVEMENWRKGFMSPFVNEE
jgi:hypothetical protein